MNSLLTILSIIFPLISFPYVSRILQPEGIGRVSFVMSVISYFTMIAQLGIPTYGIRECAKLRDNKRELSIFVKEIITINILTCIVTYILFIFCIVCIPKFRNEKILFIVMGCSIFFNSAGIEWLYKGLEEYSYITKRSLLFKFIAFIGMFVLVKQETDILMYGILMIFASVGSNICNWINAKKLISLDVKTTITLRKHIRPIFLFFLLSIASTIYTNLDNVMIGLFSNNKEVGYYTAAIKVKAALVSIVTSLGTVLLPRASYYIERKEYEKFFLIAQKSLEFTTVLSIPFIFFFSQFAKYFILILSGSNYLSSVPVMIILMPTVLFIGLTNILGLQILVPLGMEKKVFISVLVGALVDFIINIFLIPKYGAIGAAVGTLFAEIFVFLIQVISYKRKNLVLLKNIQWMKILVASVFSILCSAAIYDMNIAILLKIIFSVGVFFSVYIIILVFLKEKIVIELIHKFRIKFESR